MSKPGTAPPTFAEARTLRQKALAAGLDPSYWYAVEFEDRIQRNQVHEVRFWHASVALYRGDDGHLRAIENRCAHRQLKLSAGRVDGCRLTCAYHGWEYDGSGRLARIPHELFGRALPNVQLKSYPVRSRYGLVWVFLGEPSEAERRPLPAIPELEGGAPWISTPMDYVVRCHPTMVVNNIMDSTHVAAVHRRVQTRSFISGLVTYCQAAGDQVTVRHETRANSRSLLRYLVPQAPEHLQEAVYDYPYLRVAVGETFRLWNFMLPIDETTTRVFMLPLVPALGLPWTSWVVPRALLAPVLWLSRRLIVKPLFDEDVLAMEMEQTGYHMHYDEPAVDLHPAIKPCYQLTVRKWEACVAAAPSAGHPL